MGQLSNTFDLVRTGGQFPAGFGQGNGLSNILMEASGMSLKEAKGGRYPGGSR